MKWMFQIAQYPTTPRNYWIDVINTVERTETVLLPMETAQQEGRQLPGTGDT